MSRPQIPANVAAFMEAHGVTSDEIWQLPGGRSYAIKHLALERIAAERQIVFDMPQIIEGSTADKTVTLLVVARMGERTEWSFGEACPANNKNAYTWAMAEKRAKDRLILKLLNAHGAVYSEEEADDFKRGRANDDGPNPDYVPARSAPAHNDEFPGDASRRVSSHALRNGQPGRWDEVVRTMRASTSYDALRAFSSDIRDEVAAWPESWREQLTEVYEVERDRLRSVAA